MKKNRVLSLAFLASLPAMLSLGCSPETQAAVRVLGSDAKPVIEEHSCNPDAWVVDGNFDAGYQVLCTIHNAGSDGLIRVIVHMTCSEGNFSRTQDIFFGAGQRRGLDFAFTEPTINASNIQYRINTLPPHQ